MHKTRWLFNVKAVIVPACWIAMFGWAIAKTHGTDGVGIFNQPATIHGSTATWAWFAALNSALGNFATLAL